MSPTWAVVVALTGALTALGCSPDASGSGSPGSATGGTGAGTGGGSFGLGGNPAGAIPPSGSPCVAGTPYGAPTALSSPQVVHQGTGSGLFEGPVWVAALGTLYLSDMTFGGAGPPPSVIHQYAPAAGTGAVFIEGTGSNGLALGVDGVLVGACHEPQGLTLFDPTTTGRQALPITYLGAHFNSPNDLTIRSDGNTYFTDPDWQLGGRVNETGMTGVYRLAPDRVTVVLVDGTLDRPNGIALSPDGGVLYVSDYNGGGSNGRIGAYPVAADGSTGPRVDFVLPAIPGPDGMTVDCAGNVYACAHDGGVVMVYSPAGTLLDSIVVAASLTNVAFGGPNASTLYATAGKAVYAIPMSVPGLAY